jgi:hypothetical protein
VTGNSTKEKMIKAFLSRCLRLNTPFILKRLIPYDI